MLFKNKRAITLFQKQTSSAFEEAEEAEEVVHFFCFWRKAECCTYFEILYWCWDVNHFKFANLTVAKKILFRPSFCNEVKRKTLSFIKQLNFYFFTIGHKKASSPQKVSTVICECFWHFICVCFMWAGCDHALPGCTGELQDAHSYMRPLHTHNGVAMEPLLQWHLPPFPSPGRLCGSKRKDQQQPAATSATPRASTCCWRCWWDQIWRNWLPRQRWVHYQRQARGRGDLPALQLGGEILWSVRQSGAIWWLWSLWVPAQLLQGLRPAWALPPRRSLHVLWGIQCGSPRSC